MYLTCVHASEHEAKLIKNEGRIHCVNVKMWDVNRKSSLFNKIRSKENKVESYEYPKESEGNENESQKWKRKYKRVIKMKSVSIKVIKMKEKVNEVNVSE